MVSRKKEDDMNLTLELFKENDVYKEKIKELVDKGEEDEAIALEYERLEYVKKTFYNLYSEKGFHITIEKIEDMLGLPERYIRDNILEEVDYFVTVDGCSEAFKDINLFVDLNFFERRYYKWKKIYIEENSFLEYLTKYLKYLKEIKEEIVEDDKKKTITTFQETDCDRDYIYNYLFEKKNKLYRRAEIKDLIIEIKRERMRDRAYGDLNARRKELDNRYDIEKEKLDKFNIYNKKINIYGGELERFIKKNKNERFNLYFPPECQNRKPLSTKNQATVLYHFLEFKI